MLLERLDGETFGIGDIAVAFGNNGDACAVFGQELRGVIADIAEALHDDRDALQIAPAVESDRAGVAKKALDGELDAPARRFRAAGDAALRQRFACDAGRAH